MKDATMLTRWQDCAEDTKPAIDRDQARDKTPTRERTE
jgi:hypothetical protein